MDSYRRQHQLQAEKIPTFSIGETSHDEDRRGGGVNFTRGFSFNSDDCVSTAAFAGAGNQQQQLFDQGRALDEPNYRSLLSLRESVCFNIFLWLLCFSRKLGIGSVLIALQYWSLNLCRFFVCISVQKLCFWRRSLISLLTWTEVLSVVAIYMFIH